MIKNPPKNETQRKVREFGRDKNEVGYCVYYGGGKTYLSLCWLWDRTQDGHKMLPALVIVPTSNLTEWQNEIKNIANSLIPLFAELSINASVG